MPADVDLPTERRRLHRKMGKGIVGYNSNPSVIALLHPLKVKKRGNGRSGAQKRRDRRNR